MSFFQVLYVELIKWENTIQIAKNAKMLAVKLRAEHALSMRLQFEKSWMFASTKQFKYYDAKNTSKIHAMSDKVSLCVKNIKSIQSSKKLDYKYYEFYTISVFINKQFYRLNFSFNMKKIHNVFYVSLLESCKELAEKKHASFIYVDEKKTMKNKTYFKFAKTL